MAFILLNECGAPCSFVFWLLSVIPNTYKTKALTFIKQLGDTTEYAAEFLFSLTGITRSRFSGYDLSLLL